MMEILSEIGFWYFTVGVPIGLIIAIALRYNAIAKKREKENPTPFVPKGDLGVDLIERHRTSYSTRQSPRWLF